MADNDSTQASTPAATTSATKAAPLGYILVVRHAFGDYQVGEEITDAIIIKEILEGEQAIYVIKRAA
ncbi:hypothetical protein [Pantoea sp. GbtcB22]|uniref:hypothetical protein n=1 Tax=Pantoea sp. GbtcB22 TaxID=2824767 RepID=UPI001C2FDB23|nr:hypothetical protein [Pantoea sp. GbtcB22]